MIRTALIALTLSVSALGGVAAVSLPAAAETAAAVTAPATVPVYYRTVKVDGLDIFYREAGDPKNPTILLLHGFPSSSHHYRDLIRLLADKYHVVAPDYPGYGFSSKPDRAAYKYTFDNLYKTTDKFTRAVGIDRFAVYIFDYGAPVGLRFALHQPERVTAIISQNGNLFEEGFTPFWDPIRTYWKTGAEKDRSALKPLLTLDTTRLQYTAGVPNKDRINPDAIYSDQRVLDLPGNDQIQLDLFYDYRTNVPLYPAMQKTIIERKIPVLAVWGKGDPIFGPAGAEAFRRIPGAEVHLLDAGHFALETEADRIAGLIREFLPRTTGAR